MTDAYAAPTYIDAMVDDVFADHHSSLLVVARGLGEHVLLAALAQRAHTASPQRATLLLGASPALVVRMERALALRGAAHCARALLDAGKTERERKYRRWLRTGGLLVLQARAAVLDLLGGALPPAALAGAILCNAGELRDESADAFAVRVLVSCIAACSPSLTQLPNVPQRRGNALARIVGICAAAEQLATPLGALERTARLLRAQRVLLYPRFRDAVKAALERRDADVSVLAQPLSVRMRGVQTALLALIALCVAELRRAAGQVSQAAASSKLSVRDVLTREFERMVTTELTPRWYSLGAKSRRLVADLRALRRLLFLLVKTDAVDFYRCWRLVAENEAQWLFDDAAQKLEKLARERVYFCARGIDPAALDVTYVEHHNEDSKKKSAKKNDDEEGDEKIVHLILEPPPKWEALEQILLEIEQTERKIDLPQGTVLIVAADERRANQISQYLKNGPAQTMRTSFDAYCRYRRRRATAAASRNRAAGNRTRNVAGAHERMRRAWGGGQRRKQAGIEVQTSSTHVVASARSEAATEGDDADEEGDESEAEKADGDWQAALPVESSTVMLVAGTDPGQTLGGELSAADQESSFVANFGLLSQPQIMICTLDQKDTLFEIRPRYVVLMQPDVAYLRTIERFNSGLRGVPLRVYYLYYDESVEQAHNECLLKDELDAFRSLIDGKSKLLLPSTYDDERDPNAPSLEIDVDNDDDSGESPFSISAKNKKRKIKSVVGGQQGGGLLPPADLVIVDTREFRSSLPSMLHKDRLRIQPATLKVGDYILTPEICIERKSVSDLISSLNSGHLYDQAIALCRLYKRPVLLIEFDERRAFGLEPPDMLSADISGGNVQSKLTLLTLHFPRLCVMMSRTPRDTAKLFRSLKEGQPDPDINSVDAAASAAKEAGENEDFIRALPGVNARNIIRIMNKCENLSEFLAKSKTQLQDLMGTEEGATCYQFIRKELRIKKKIE